MNGPAKTTGWSDFERARLEKNSIDLYSESYIVNNA